MSERILRLPAVKSATGLGKSTIYDRIRKGQFPGPISLGPGRCVGWTESSIQAWIGALSPSDTKGAQDE